MITKAELPNTIGQKDHPMRGAFLNCSRCGGEYSAESGDYWYMDADTVMECCGEPMQLARKLTTYDVLQ